MRPRRLRAGASEISLLDTQVRESGAEERQLSYRRMNLRADTKRAMLGVVAGSKGRDRNSKFVERGIRR